MSSTSISTSISSDINLNSYIGKSINTLVNEIHNNSGCFKDTKIRIYNEKVKYDKSYYHKCINVILDNGKVKKINYNEILK